MTDKQLLKLFDRYLRKATQTESALRAYYKASPGGTPQARHWERYDKYSDEAATMAAQILVELRTRAHGINPPDLDA